MKIILLKDIKKLGKKDEIVEVKDGYAKFLINNNQAVLYTHRSNEVLNREISSREEQEEKLIDECNKLKIKLEAEKPILKVKVGSNGKLFGTVSTKQIHEKLIELGYKIDKKKIEKPDITTIGNYEVKINLHSKVKAKIKINVKSE